MTSLALGNLLTESTAYNNRLQPTSITVGPLVSLGYAYGTSNNNGNVQSQTITAPGLSLTQSYGYDWLNRLTGMNETSGWSETFSYDPYGNRTGGSSSSAYMPLQIPTINAQTNKISAANHSYDAVGNLTQGLGADGLVKTYTYDADNRLMTFNGSAATYSYDGDGRRVKKVVGSATTVFVYDARGQMVAEYSNQAPPTSGGTSYVTADHLGSTRLVTDSTGTVIARHDYAPFGEEITSVIGGRGGVTGYGVDEGLRQKFTGKERDSESGLDYYLAKYYGSNMGRFMSPDDGTEHDSANPQSLNRYTYVHNNPLRFIDPYGHSTHTAANGDVLAVYNEGDNGVYQHTDIDNRMDWDRSKLDSDDEGSNYMGETPRWDEFAAHDRAHPNGISGTAMKDALIHFGISINSQIAELNEIANKQGLTLTALLSRSGWSFDIKSQAWADSGPGTGYLLNGGNAEGLMRRVRSPQSAFEEATPHLFHPRSSANHRAGARPSAIEECGDLTLAIMFKHRTKSL